MLHRKSGAAFVTALSLLVMSATLFVTPSVAAAPSIMPLLASPSPPTLSSPGNGASLPQSSDVTLMWNSSSGATQYKVELWGGPYSTMTPCNWQSGMSCHIGQMWPGTMSWHVKARNSSGQESAWSSTWTFTIRQQQSTPTPLPPSGPAGYTFCSNENQRCTFSGTKDVAYGANGKFNYKYGVTGGINCNNSTFGDPNSGVAKACYTRGSSVTPSQLRVVEALSLSTTNPRVNQSVTARFKVKNVGGQAMTMQELTAAARRGSDWNGEWADFPHVSNITLQPGQEYTYQQSRSFSTAGSYFAEPTVKLNGNWGGIGGANRVNFTVQAPPQSGKCQKGGQYGLTVDRRGLHHYIEFNVGNYATKNGSGWRLQPSSVSASVKIGNRTVTKVLGTSLWPVERDKSYVRFGISGDGIVALITSSSTFTVCWDQK